MASSFETLSHYSSIALCVLVVSTSACVGPRREVAVERTLADALAFSEAVEFRAEDGALDASSTTPDTLALAHAVRRAVETSPELRAAVARVRAAEAEADLASALPNPVLSVVFRFPEGGGGTDVEAGLAADLLALLQRPRRASAAASRLEAEVATTLAAALDVVAEVQGLYASAQALEALLPLLEARLGVFDRLREVADARLELGEGTRHDVTSLESERLRLAVEIAQRRQEARRVRLALARRIGEPSSAAAWPLEAWHPPVSMRTDEDAWVDTALRARPEVLAVEWELRALGEEVALARASALEGASLSVEGEREEDWSVGPGASIPLPLFDTGSARKRRALAREAEARARLLEAQRTVIEEVRAALGALASAQDNLTRVAGELVPLQERRRSEIDEAYRLGLVDVTDLLFAEQALQDAQSLRVGLERDVSTALLELERSVGGRSRLDSGASPEEINP
jgi:cobalt-zinc-cadmium efflux system outer membrane protein